MATAAAVGDERGGCGLSEGRRGCPSCSWRRAESRGSRGGSGRGRNRRARPRPVRARGRRPCCLWCPSPARTRRGLGVAVMVLVGEKHWRAQSDEEGLGDMVVKLGEGRRQGVHGGVPK